MLRADLHVHTNASPDSKNTPEALVARAIAKGLNCLAITDHNTMDNVSRVQELAPFKIIPAEEIATTQGEIIGLFLQERIPKGLTPLEVVRQIKDQEGLVYVPHPFDRTRRSVIWRSALEEILSFVDALEVFNSRTTLLRDSLRARNFAARHGLPMGGGSDAHTLIEVGNTYVELPDFDGPKDFLRALSEGEVNGRRTNLLIHVITIWTKRQKKRKAKKAAVDR